MEIEIIDDNFQFPENLNAISETERAALHLAHVRHVSTTSRSCETDPSVVMSSEEIARRRQRAISSRQNYEPEEAPVYNDRGVQIGEFKSGIGYVIEDQTAVTKHVSLEKIASEKALEEYKKLSDAERDAEDRFGDIS